MELWKALATSGMGAGLLLCAQILFKGFLDRRKTSAEAFTTEVGGEVQLSQQALQFLAAVRADAQRQIELARADAQAQIAGARADAANSVAASMHEVSTVRGEASQMRSDGAAMRNTMERIEQLLLWVRAEVWRPGPEDPRVARVRDRLGDGSMPLSTLVNGSLH